MDWNEVVNSLADLVADRVVAKLRNADGSNWPNTEIKDFPNTDPSFLLSRIANIDAQKPEADDPGDEEVTPEVEVPEPPAKQPDRKAERKAYWQKVPVGVLREILAGYEGADIAKYRAMSKAKLVDYAADLETLTGHDLPEQSDEEDLIEQEQDAREQMGEDDDLTYEEALTLDLAELKKIATDNGITSDELKGLDVEAVADLLFAEEEYSQEELLDMGREELEALAKREKIEYDPNISRQDLALLIVDNATQE